MGRHAALLAHRGSAQSSGALENSREAFDACLAKPGLTAGLETDVHVTKDGHAVIAHDPQWHAVAGDITIAKVTWTSLREQRLPNGEGPLDLAEFLERYPDVYLNFDAKVDAAAQALIEHLQGRSDLARFGLGSFAASRVWMMARALGHEPGYLLGGRDVLRFIALQASGAVSLGRLRKNSWLVPRLLRHYRVALAVPEKYGLIPVVTSRLVANAHRWGMPVYVWTVNDSAQFQRLSRMGVDAVYTDIVHTIHAQMI